jgi:hypothetical protein
MERKPQVSPLIVLHFVRYWRIPSRLPAHPRLGARSKSGSNGSQSDPVTQRCFFIKGFNELSIKVSMTLEPLPPRKPLQGPKTREKVIVGVNLSSHKAPQSKSHKTPQSKYGPLGFRRFCSRGLAKTHSAGLIAPKETGPHPNVFARREENFSGPHVYRESFSDRRIHPATSR